MILYISVVDTLNSYNNALQKTLYSKTIFKDLVCSVIKDAYLYRTAVVDVKEFEDNRVLSSFDDYRIQSTIVNEDGTLSIHNIETFDNVKCVSKYIKSRRFIGTIFRVKCEQEQDKSFVLRLKGLSSGVDGLSKTFDDER